MRIFNIVSALILGFLLASCAHTNELAKFDVQSSKILFKQIVSSQARFVKIEKLNQANTQNNNKNRNFLSNVLNTVAKVSTDILAADKQEKLRKLISTNTLLSAITDNLAESMITYLDIIPVNNLSDNPDFICTVKLNSCKLLIDKEKLDIYVSSSADLIERASGQIVWKNTESRRIPLQKSYNTKLNAGDLNEVLSALQLAALEEKQINAIVDQAADDVGLYMAETLREDVAKSHKERKKLRAK